LGFGPDDEANLIDTFRVIAANSGLTNFSN